MVRMSTADFINLISNLKEDVNIAVSIDNVNVEEKKVLSKYEVCTSDISVKEENETTNAQTYTSVTEIAGHYYNTEDMTKMDVSLLETKKELSITEELEQKVTKAFLDIGYDISSLANISEFATTTYKTNYYCSETDSSLLILHPYQCPPHAFAIDDRGITKQFTLKSTDLSLNAFDIEHPIKVLM